MQFVLDTHTAAIVRANANHTSPPATPRQPWSPSVPTLDPWRSLYLALDPAGQRRWDAMSPARRSLVFGVP